MMLDMAQAVTQAASAASRSGVKMSELSSLIALAASATNESGTEIGQTLRELFSTLQDTDNQAVTDAFNALHISMTEIVNGSESLKTPVQLLKELADTLDGLPADDVFRSDVLSGIGGTENADTLSAMLDNWSSFEDMLRLYDSGMGSAAQTAEQYAANWEGSLNRLSNTWQDTVHNILSSDVMTAITNQLNGFLSVINKITDKLGSLGSIGVGAGLFAGLKNVGRDKMDSPHFCFAPFQPGMGAFRLTAVLVQMGNRPVQNQQEQDAQPKPDHRREKRPPAHILRLFHGGNQQAPNRCRRHNPGGKAGQSPLEHQIHSSF